jgi:hypothetical protein
MLSCASLVSVVVTLGRCRAGTSAELLSRLAWMKSYMVHKALTHGTKADGAALDALMDVGSTAAGTAAAAAQLQQLQQQVHHELPAAGVPIAPRVAGRGFVEITAADPTRPPATATATATATGDVGAGGAAGVAAGGSVEDDDDVDGVPLDDGDDIDGVPVDGEGPAFLFSRVLLWRPLPSTCRLRVH